MERVISSFVAGLVFGLGLAVSGMINPAKVTAFLDIAGNWDPSLALVMVSALAVTAIGYRLTLKRTQPFFATAFVLPTRQDLDRNLIGGAALFGAGWGLSGYCPGPALAGLGLGELNTVIFVASMIVGMNLARLAGSSRPHVGLDNHAGHR